MSYIVTNTRGQIVAVVQDGTVDTTSTSQTLIGKNFTPFGQLQLDNMVHQLENFANTTPPPFPIPGQFWYNITEERAYAWSGAEWKPVSGVTVAESAPTADPRTGDFWFNPVTRQLEIYSPTTAGFDWIPVAKVTIAATAPVDALAGAMYFNSTSQQFFVRNNDQWNLVGPEGVLGFATTRWQSSSLLDTGNVPRAVVLGTVNGVVVAIMAAEDFTIRADQRPSGFTALVSGINLSTDSVLNGRASLANNVTGVVASANGGTGFASYTPGQILLGTSTGSLGRGTLTASNPIAVTASDSGFVLSWAGPNIPAQFGTVTSVGLAAGDGMSVSGSPVSTTGTITVTNTGVLNITAGAGISVSAATGNVNIVNTGVTSIIPGPNITVNSSNGAVTISAASNGTVTEVNTGAGLVGGPITSSGSISVDSTVVRTNATQTITSAKTFTGGITSQTYNLQDSTYRIGSATGPNRIAVTVANTTSSFFYPNRFVVVGDASQQTSDQLGRGGAIVGIDTGAGGQAGVFGETSQNGVGVRAGATSLAFAGATFSARTSRAGSSGFALIQAFTSGTVQFVVDGQGATVARSFTPTGGDYAEYFEWADGNPDLEDRVGRSVCLVGHQIRLAQPGDDVIGVISAMAGVIGDAAELTWRDMYQKDDFGRIIQEPYQLHQWSDDDGTEHEEPSYGDVSRVPPHATVRHTDFEGQPLMRPVLNPAFDDTTKYVPRSRRPEWAVVGLLGKLRVLRGQPTGAGWIKLRDVSPDVEEWLIK